MVGSLSIGIALFVVTFAVARAIIGSDVPGTQARDRLVVIGASLQRGPLYPLSVSDYEKLTAGRLPSALQGIGGELRSLATVIVKGEPYEAHGALVSGSYFPILRCNPVLGRLIVPADDWTGATPVVVVGYEFWRRALKGDPAAVGRFLQINAEVYRVVGVAPAGFVGLEMNSLGQNADAGHDYWIPLSQAVPRLAPSRALKTIGRLADGAQIADADAQLRAYMPKVRAGPQASGRLAARPLHLGLENMGSIYPFILFLFFIPALDNMEMTGSPS